MRCSDLFLSHLSPLNIQLKQNINKMDIKNKQHTNSTIQQNYNKIPSALQYYSEFH